MESRHDNPPKADEEDTPSFRQRLASATGDRGAEAKALADRAGDAVSAEEAEIAVRAAHGDINISTDDPGRDSDLASPSDAERVRDHASE